MRVISKIITLLTTLTLTGLGVWFFIKNNKPLNELYKIENPQRRTIKHLVTTSGILEMKEIMKVGSIKLGAVKEIYVKENEKVTKGQVLAFIDTAFNRSEAEAAEHRMLKAQKELDYQKEFFTRQESLYLASHTSKDTMQKALKDLKKAEEDVAVEKATLRKSSLEYESTKIKAPEDGVVIAIHTTKGMVVGDLNTAMLFEIAADVCKMRAVLDIDESDIGHVTQGQEATIIPNSFPDMRIKNPITDVSFVPKTNGSTTTSYKALLDVDNKNCTLRPGMIVNGTIKIKQADNVLSISGLAFYTPSQAIQHIASKLNYDYKPVAVQDTESEEKGTSIKKYVWTVKNKTFIQKAVTVGISDNMLWEIKNGLDESDAVVNDLCESDEMEELYKKWFGGAL